MSAFNLSVDEGLTPARWHDVIRSTKDVMNPVFGNTFELYYQLDAESPMECLLTLTYSDEEEAWLTPNLKQRFVERGHLHELWGLTCFIIEGLEMNSDPANKARALLRTKNLTSRGVFPRSLMWSRMDDDLRKIRTDIMDRYSLHAPPLLREGDSSQGLRKLDETFGWEDGMPEAVRNGPWNELAALNRVEKSFDTWARDAYPGKSMYDLGIRTWDGVLWSVVKCTATRITPKTKLTSKPTRSELENLLGIDGPSMPSDDSALEKAELRAIRDNFEAYEKIRWRP